MLLRVFRDNQAFTIIFLFLISIVLWGLVVFKQTFEPSIHTIYNYFGFHLFPALRSINNNISISTFLNLLLVLISGLYLSRITYRFQLIPGRNLLPMLVFFFLSLPWFSSFTGFSYPLLTLLILLFVIDRLFQSAEKKSLSFSYFNCAIIISAASILNYYLIFYLLFIIFLFVRLRGIYWRELVFIFLGALLPYFLLFGLMYLFNSDISDFLSSISVLWQYKLVFESDSVLLGFGAFILLIYLLSSWHLANRYIKMKIITRKYSITLFVLFLLTLLIVFIVPSVNKDGIFFIAFPLSFLIGYYFTTCRINILNQVLFLLFLLGNVGVLIFSFS